jgi:aspartyl-tRNA(Asn)/glutamyl-tRNA(Gln) amidotransferase subunit B
MYNPDYGETYALRSKESAHDYRYFPEPDLVPLRVSKQWLGAIQATMPELPARKRLRFLSEYGLREYDADTLTQSRAVSDYFETAAGVSGDPKATANWVMGELMGLLKAEGKTITDAPVTAQHLGELVSLIAGGELSGKMAKEVFAKMAATGDSAAAIVEREGLKQISDSSALETVIAEVIAANPRQIEQYTAGKTTVLNFLVGQVMRTTRGQANVAAVKELLKRKLG